MLFVGAMSAKNWQERQTYMRICSKVTQIDLQLSQINIVLVQQTSKAIEFGEKLTQNKGYYALQGHWGRCQLKAFMHY